MTVSFVDIDKRPLAAAELRRFTDRFGAAALLDVDSKAYRKANLAYLRLDGAETFERLLADPGLLVLPLVRYGNDLTAGVDEETWRRWHAAGG